MRKPPQKGIVAYFLPYLLLAAAVYLILYFTNTGTFNFSTSAPLDLEVINPNVEVLLKSDDEWKSLPSSSVFKLFEGDAIKNDVKGESKLVMQKDSFIYLDNNASLSLVTHKESDSYQETNLRLGSGNVFVKISRIINPKSQFVMQYGNIHFKTRGATFVIQDNNLQVLEGKIDLEKKVDKTLVSSSSIELGQQINFNTESISQFEEKSVLDSSAYSSGLVKKAWGKIDSEAVSNELLDNDLESESSLEAEETDNKEQESDLVSQDSDDNKNDLAKSDYSIEINKLPDPFTDELLELKGTVTKGAQKVIINDYTLSQFKEGDTSWTYRAKKEWGNLAEGENTYEIKAVFSDETVVTKEYKLNYEPKQTDETDDAESESTQDESIKEDANIKSDADSVSEKTDDTENTAEENSDDSSPKLSVLSPSEGEKIDSDPVEVSGTAPLNTAKILIGDYELRSFKPGDLTWKYRASKEYNNLKYGEENVYLIQALNSEDEEIASIRFSFFSTASE